MSKLKAALLTIGFSAFLVTAMPAPAHADISLGSLLSSLMSSIGQAITSIVGAGQTAAAATVASAKQLADLHAKGVDATNQATDNAAKQGAMTAATIAAQDVPDAACQIAANSMDEGQRKQKEDEASKNMAAVLAGLYNAPSSGTLLGKDKILNALCQLGGTGVNGRCTVAAQPGLEGSDHDVTLPVIKNACIPYDHTKIEAELNKLKNLADGATYTLGDANMREAMIALLSIRVNRAFDLSARPNGKETETISGHENEAKHSQNVSQILASDEPLLRALFWNTCFSTAMLPNCQTSNSKLITFLNNNNTPDMPPAGYCISYTQKNLAEMYQFQELLANIGDLSGQPPETATLAMHYNDAILKRRERHEEVMEKASAAAQNRPENVAVGPSARPTATENEIRDLKDSIRKLTRVIEQSNGRFPRAQDARLDAVPADASALPPLRQDFPAVP